MSMPFDPVWLSGPRLRLRLALPPCCACEQCCKPKPKALNPSQPADSA